MPHERRDRARVDPAGQEHADSRLADRCRPSDSSSSSRTRRRLASGDAVIFAVAESRRSLTSRDLPPVRAHAHDVARGQHSNVADERQRLRDALVREKLIQRGTVQRPRHQAGGEERAHLGRKHDVAVPAKHVERLDPQSIAREPEPLRDAVPDREGEHAAQPLDDRRAPFLVPLEDDLGVRPEWNVRPSAWTPAARRGSCRFRRCRSARSARADWPSAGSRVAEVDDREASMAEDHRRRVVPARDGVSQRTTPSRPVRVGRRLTMRGRRPHGPPRPTSGFQNSLRRCRTAQSSAARAPRDTSRSSRVEVSVIAARLERMSCTAAAAPRPPCSSGSARRCARTDAALEMAAGRRSPGRGPRRAPCDPARRSNPPGSPRCPREFT